MDSLSEKQKNKNSLGCIIALMLGFFVVGILGAIALPSFLAQPTKAKQVEAKYSIGSILKAQEAYHRETRSFANNFDDLKVRIEPQTNNYIYFTTATKTAAFSYAISRDSTIKSYVGAVFLVPAKDGMKTVSILCQAKSKGIARLQDPMLQNGVITCGTDSKNTM